MEEKDKRRAEREEIDRFWDVASLVPKKGRTAPVRSSPQGTYVEFAPTTSAREQEKKDQTESNTVITRYIPPHGDGRLTQKEQYDSSESYEMQNSLLHRVTLKKLSCPYQYYGEFLQDALRYREIVGEESPYVPFFSYVPQYNQLTEEQLGFYFWFRDNARRGSYIDTDACYVLLYAFELINLGDRLDVRESQRQLTELWNAYHVKFPLIEGKLIDWICDFSLIHRLPPPTDGTLELANKARSLKEYYIAMPRGDIDGCVGSLLKFCNAYDYRKSKFYKNESAELFETYVFGALREAVRFYSRDGRLLSELTNEDSRLMRDSYAGALCVAKERYRIEVEYCSFSRSNELRFLVGDIVKYTENRIRGVIGVKSKMSVYSVPTELRTILDEYLDNNLPKKRAERRSEEKQAYEAMYDIPRKPLSLTDARRIEQESWATTRDLVEAFEEEASIEQVFAEDHTEKSESTSEEQSLRTVFGELWTVLLALREGRRDAVYLSAKEAGKMPDSLADRINEIAFEAIGDALIEEISDGYQIIEDYMEMFE